MGVSLSLYTSFRPTCNHSGCSSYTQANMEMAYEYMPESFGRVHMLYVDAMVNKTHVKAFVDSGAQQTIMSGKCAQRCGIMRLVDTKFAGTVSGW